jgi:hypothetical protein
VGGFAGYFLLTVSTSMKPKLPILFFAQVNTPPAPDGSAMLALMIEPLDAKDRKTIVGPTQTLPPAPIDQNGRFVVGPVTVDVPGAANPITFSDLLMNVSLSGTICNVSGLNCGEISGQVTKPITLDLKGSTFTLDGYLAPGVPPNPPLIDCNMVPADAPPPAP